MNPKDDEAIRAVVARWQQCWNCGDMAAAAALFCEDADFVNVRGSHWQGRGQIESEHARIHRTNMKGSVIAPLDIGVQLISAGMALVHIRWSNQGGRNPDGTPLQSAQRMFSWLMVGGGQNHWLIRAAHNTPIASST